MPPAVELAKDIWELINFEAGITDADVSDYFEENEEEDMDEEAQLLNNPPHKKLQSAVCMVW
jgi:hypothetical protein